MKLTKRSVAGLVVFAAALASAASSQAATIKVEASSSCGSPVTSTTADVATGASVALPCTSVNSLLSITGQASARGSFLTTLLLGAFATADVLSAGGSYTNLGFQARSTFTDAITLLGGNPGDPGFLQLSFAIDGTSSSTGTVYSLGGGLYAGNGVVNSIGRTFRSSTTVTGTIPYTFGQQSTLSIMLLASAQGNVGPFSGLSFEATADFFSTANLLSVEVLDANRQLLPDGAVTSASGLTYPTSSAVPVPEPGTAVLVGTGATALLRRFRNRRPTRRSRF